MILKIRARHFKNTAFFTPCNCAISKALKELYPEGDVPLISEQIDYIIVAGKEYKHESYPAISFHEDQANAVAHNFDDTVIRVVNIEGLEPTPELSTVTAEQLLREPETVV